MNPQKFQALIIERNTELIVEAKEKRDVDLKRIQNINSREGQEPFDVFPEEIWIIILDKLNPEDKHNLRELHESFRFLTDETLLGDILLPLTLRTSATATYQNQAAIASIAHCTELRLLSKSMRNEVDGWFEKDLIFRLQSGHMKLHPSAFVQVELLNPKHLEKLSRIKANLISTPTSAFAPELKKRFFKRALSVKFPAMFSLLTRSDPRTRNRFAEMRANLNFILNKVGDQILYFSCVFNGDTLASRIRREELDQYVIVLKILRKMPNLKWFRVIIPAEEEWNPSGGRVVVPDIFSCPVLQNLERVDFEIEREPATNPDLVQFCHSFLSANSHIKTLNLNGSTETWSYLGDTHLQLQQLEAFSVNVHSSEMNVNLFGSHWPLKMIELRMDNMHWTSSLYSVLGSLNVFPTLEKVKLKIGNAKIGNDKCFLELPQLKYFEMTLKSNFDADDGQWNDNFSFFFSLQFLLFAKRLNTLVWKCELRERDWETLRQKMRTSEMINFEGGWNAHAARSNLWKVFPWLKIVNVELVELADGGDEKTTTVMKYCAGQLHYVDESTSFVTIEERIHSLEIFD